MRAFGSPLEVINTALDEIKLGMEEIKEGINLIDSYDLQLVFEDTDEFTKEDMIEAIEKIRQGFATLNGDNS